MSDLKDQCKLPVDTTEVSQVPPTHDQNAPATSKAPEEPQSPQASAQIALDRTLHFLANASNETLGACLVGLGATTYLVLGRVGLVLIGVVGGVVLHATWEKGTFNKPEGSDLHKDDRKKRETALEVAQRVLNWRSAVADEHVSKNALSNDLDIKLLSGEDLDFTGFKPETSQALTELTDAVIRDYVKWWYSPILPTDDLFPAASRRTLTAFIHGISTHLSRKRPADSFLDFLTNSSSIIIVYLNELGVAINASPGQSPAQAIETYLELKPGSNLANALDTENQEKKLEMVAEDMLQNFLEHKTYNCQPAHIFLRQILAKVVLEMTIQSCSRPEWINGWIVYLLEDGEPELMHAIDAGVEMKAGGSQGPLSTVEKNDSSEATQGSNAKHKRVVSKAQEAMDDAMKEAQRLTQLMAEEDARIAKEQGNQQLGEQIPSQQPSSSSSQSNHNQRATAPSTLSDDTSEGTTHGIATPASSQGEFDEANTTQSPPLASPSMESGPGPVEPTTANPGTPKSQFTSFDQLVMPVPQSPERKEPPALTLHNANISLIDDSMPGDRGLIRTKPTAEYFVQIEPASSHYPGWMITRKFADFETLHEILRRIANISGVNGFSEAHANLPTWKGHTKPSLRGELERYINDAVRFKPLAESEGMKRFLEKENGMAKAGGQNKSFPGLGWPTPSAFESMGKGMIDVLAKAPVQVAGGGKALFGNVTGVLGGKRTNSITSPTLSRTNTDAASPSPLVGHQRAQSTIAPLPSEIPSSAHMRSESTASPRPSMRKSQDSLRALSIVDTQPEPIQQMERRPSWNPDDIRSRTSVSSRRSSAHFASRDHSRAPSVRSVRSNRNPEDLSPLMGGDQILNLPPPPTDMPDDYHESPTISPRNMHYPASSPSKSPVVDRLDMSKRSHESSRSSQQQMRPVRPPISEQETTVAIELLFAIITELYTLSSAWQIRKTLLQAAKNFLLRPGNPQLESIRQMLQETVLDSNTSDAGIASHIRKLRLNSLPTEDELKLWPAESSPDEKEKLRRKARKLLVERGMPVALTGVMGQQSTGEALGRVFDCLQVEKISRGLMFGVMLQAVRAIIQ